MRFEIFIIGLIFGFYFLTTYAEDNKHPFMIKKVLLVVAEEQEAQPIISKLHLHKIKNAFAPLPMQAYQGSYAKKNIFLVLNGVDPINKVQNVGSQAATLSTYLGIHSFHPDLVISVGSAGGLEVNHARLNEIYYSRKIYFYDRRLPSPKGKKYGLGNYPSITIPLLAKLGLQEGIVCSGDSFDNDVTDYARLMKFHCDAVDMEAAGVAWVSMLMHTPMFALKGITNFLGRGDIHTEYRENLPKMTVRLAEKLQEFLRNEDQNKMVMP